MHKSQPDYSVSVAKTLDVSLASTHGVGTCANVTERRSEQNLPRNGRLARCTDINSTWSQTYGMWLGVWCPVHVLKGKLDVYIAECHIVVAEKYSYAQVCEEMFGVHRGSNLHGATAGDGGSATAAEPDEENRQMTEAELRRELDTRERLMQTFQGQEGIMTDQWRVYTEAIGRLQASRTPLRL